MKKIDLIKLYTEVLGEKIKDYNLPPPSFEIMQCEIVKYNKDEKFITIKIPTLESWLNPFGTMQGGIIMGAVDNAVGPLSLLVAPMSMTRNIESKLIKPITMEVEFIYVTATLFEQKKKRLIFDVVIKDIDETIYTKAKVTNWII